MVKYGVGFKLVLILFFGIDDIVGLRSPLVVSAKHIHDTTPGTTTWLTAEQGTLTCCNASQAKFSVPAPLNLRVHVAGSDLMLRDFGEVVFRIVSMAGFRSWKVARRLPRSDPFELVEVSQPASSRLPETESQFNACNASFEAKIVSCSHYLSSG